MEHCGLRGMMRILMCHVAVFAPDYIAYGIKINAKSIATMDNT
jgi:hypothetical protein